MTGHQVSSDDVNSGRMRICVVCLGNICRSPMAAAVLEHLIERAGLADVVTVTSAGTGDWHIGDPADPRTVDAPALPPFRP